MISIELFKEMALSLPDTTEQPHFDLSSFRLRNKIFATLAFEKHLACLMLSPVDQSVFISFDKTAVYPVPNKWGVNGATYFNLKKVKIEMLKDALELAYQNKMKPKSSRL